MNVLLLAPQPFYTERGTPIAVNLLMRVLSERGEQVDVLTYHEGRDVVHAGVQLHRIRQPWFAQHVPPGFSLRKVLCDLVMLPRAVAMVRAKSYDVIHAVEESVFIALYLKRRFKVPYVYDMDSSLARQMMEKSAAFGLLAPLLYACEGLAIRRAKAVVPVCDALAQLARKRGAASIHTLRDISLLDIVPRDESFNPRDAFHIRGIAMAYIGNLESYQGIDLLLESFAQLCRKTPEAHLVVIGGPADRVGHYRDQAAKLGVGRRVHFAGPKPLTAMRSIYESVDILVSPRIKGDNTPMKIYSYMDSGRPILATRLFTHTQVLDDSTAVLADPDPDSWAQAMERLIRDEPLRRRLGAAAKAVATAKYSYAAYRQVVNDLYNELSTTLKTCHRP